MPLSNLEPTLALTEGFVLSGAFPSRDGSGTPYTIDSIRTFAFNFAPNGTITASGQILNIASYSAVFSIVGTMYGGNGTTNFAVPNLGGSLSVSFGQGPGLSNRIEGQTFGSTTVNLTQSNLTPAYGGTSAPVDNAQPTLATEFAIVVFGTFPSPSSSTPLSSMGMIVQFAGNFAPGDTLPCDGRLLAIAEYDALFQILGTTYGGDGMTTFALPDLRGRTIVGSGTYNGQTYTVGQVVGQETVTLGTATLPAYPAATAASGLNDRQPGLVLNQLVALQGIFPSQSSGSPDDFSPYLGEVVAFAGSFVPRGWALAQGQTLAIQTNQALFSLLGTNFGGNGTTNFQLPNLAGRSVIGTDATHAIGSTQGADTFTLTVADLPAVSINGTGGDDIYYSGDANDLIQGQGGADRLYSTAGSDTLDGGAGIDTMTGGAGNDTYVVDSLSDVVTENSGEGTDTVRTLIGSYSGDLATIYNLANNVENLTMTATGGGQVAAGNALNNLITGTAFADTMVLGGTVLSATVSAQGADTVNAGGGNDFLFFNNSFDAADQVDGGSGYDTIGLVGNYTLTLGALSMVNVEQLSFYSSGNVASPVSYVITMNNGNVAAGQSLLVTAASLTTGEHLNFNGSAEADGKFQIFGGHGTDTIVGGAGADRIIAGQGADSVTGGAGNDVFQFNSKTDSTSAARDTITDFTTGDKIDFYFLDANDNVGGQQHLTYIGAAAFGLVAGQVRAFEQTASHWIVEADTNGDGTADFSLAVTVSDAHALTLADFAL